MFLQSPVMPSDQILRPFFFLVNLRHSSFYELAKTMLITKNIFEKVRMIKVEEGGLGEEEKKDGEYEMRTEYESWKFIISKDNDKKEHVKKNDIR